jgi:hypothetical protein
VIELALQSQLQVLRESGPDLEHRRVGQVVVEIGQPDALPRSAGADDGQSLECAVHPGGVHRPPVVEPKLPRRPFVGPPDGPELQFEVVFGDVDRDVNMADRLKGGRGWPQRGHQRGREQQRINHRLRR